MVNPLSWQEVHRCDAGVVTRTFTTGRGGGGRGRGRKGEGERETLGWEGAFKTSEPIPSDTPPTASLHLPICRPFKSPTNWGLST